MKNCVPDPGYSCWKNSGYIGSTCEVVCGDGVIGPNEQCDNGNQIGCSRWCIPDPGYTCIGSIGIPSWC